MSTTTKQDLLSVGSSPHIHSQVKPAQLMGDVIIALLPVTGAAIYIYGWSAVWLIAASILSAVLSEFVTNRLLRRKRETIGDLSAVVTGLLLALSVSPTVPIWAIIIGAMFAIVITKQLFGGIGHNFVNPALAGRAFMMASWPVLMTTFRFVSGFVPAGVTAVDGITSATRLTEIAQNPHTPLENWQQFLLTSGGCLGEVSGAALLLGVIWLLARRVIKLDTPLAYIVSFIIFNFALSPTGFFNVRGVHIIDELISGGLLLGAFYMVTDYTTSPMTTTGRLIFGAMCGLITVTIRRFGGYPEGVTYAILISNLFVPLIDRAIKPPSFATLKTQKQKGAENG